METKLSIPPTYTSPEFEAFYTKLEKEQLAIAGISGQQDGLANKPVSQRHYQIQVISSFRAAIQKALDYNYSLFRPVSAIAVTKELRNAAAEHILLLEKDKNGKEKKLLFLNNEQAELKSKVSYISSELKIIIPVLFGMAEGVLVFTILQGASFPGLVKFFLSIAITLAAAFGVGLGANYISKAREKTKKQKRFITVVALAWLVAAGLGVWRAALYGTSLNINAQIEQSGNAQPATSFSSLPFILISGISYLVALAFELRHWQTDEQKARIKQYEEKQAEAKKIEKQKQELKKQIEQTKAEVSAASGETLSKQEYAYGNECRLLSLAQQMVNHYEAANLEHRLDNSCPAFFGEQVTSDFKLYFDNLFHHLKQKK